jgi:hypothetical protein
VIERTTDPAFIRGLLNDPQIRPFVATDDGHIVNVDELVQNPANVCLQGEHGAILCVRYFEGCYEGHAAVREPGRGEWAHHFAEEAARYMFCATDAAELLTQVPQGHIASKALAESLGFRAAYRRPACHFGDKVVPSTIYVLSIQNWAGRGEGLDETGIAFVDWLDKQGGHLEDFTVDHARAIGVTVEMLRHGRLAKALFWYRRFSLALRVPAMNLVSEHPLSIAFGGGLLHVTDGQFMFERAH